jgi:uncharacterized protein DUF1902
MGSERLFG